jgi:hypothetical protein
MAKKLINGHKANDASRNGISQDDRMRLDQLLKGVHNASTR